jgi:hypothetical protein
MFFHIMLFHPANFVCVLFAGSHRATHLGSHSIQGRQLLTSCLGLVLIFFYLLLFLREMAIPRLKRRNGASCCLGLRPRCFRGSLPADLPGSAHSGAAVINGAITPVIARAITHVIAL